jgi:hypothetical protein
MNSDCKETCMKSTLTSSLLALAVLAAVAPAFAAEPAKASAGQAAYERERARCLAGTSSQEQATCLKEAGAALGEARAGSQDGAASTADLARNATQRCEAQPVADREACVQRIMGAGKTEGSVGGGGMIRQTTETTK